MLVNHNIIIAPWSVQILLLVVAPSAKTQAPPPDMTRILSRAVAQLQPLSDMMRLMGCTYIQQLNI